VAINTAEAPFGHLKITPSNSYGLTVDQGIGYLPPRRFQYPLKGRAGDIHLLGTLFLL